MGNFQSAGAGTPQEQTQGTPTIAITITLYHRHQQTPSTSPSIPTNARAWPPSPLSLITTINVNIYIVATFTTPSPHHHCHSPPSSPPLPPPSAHYHFHRHHRHQRQQSSPVVPQHGPFGGPSSRKLVRAGASCSSRTKKGTPHAKRDARRKATAGERKARVIYAEFRHLSRRARPTSTQRGEGSSAFGSISWLFSQKDRCRQSTSSQE